MTQITKTVDEATDKAVELIEQAQDVAIAAVSQASEMVANYVPEIGIGDALLRPEDVVESGFKVSTKFLEAGRKAALGFVGAVAPVTDKVLGSKKAKPSTKTTA